MTYDERLQNVTVLGAAGKMGSGILLLTAVEMADLSLKPENKDKVFVLNAMDVSDEALKGLISYLKVQVLKIAEKKAVQLRKWYADREDLIENFDIIREYVNDVIAIVRPTTVLESAYNSNVIFEAIKEDPALKVKIFSQLKQNSKVDPWFFTNTSSIPITELDEKAGLGGNVLGFHFYNPPAIQKLAELIRSKHTRDEVNTFALQYAKNLEKVIVPSNDFAGFIGNGHFMRDALYGIQQAQHLSKDMDMTEAIYAINRITQEYLVRPMGIFQLIDYVGIDVCSYIMSVMNPYLKDEDLHSEVLDQMLAANVKGGQYSSGAQKDGFLKYDGAKVVAVYDLKKGAYRNVEEFAEKVNNWLGKFPIAYHPWKKVNFSKDRDALLKAMFAEMNEMDTVGATLAKAYNKRSNEIGHQLVNTHVANSVDDVNTVMLTGFYHSYGPVNEYLK